MTVEKELEKEVENEEEKEKELEIEVSVNKNNKIYLVLDTINKIPTPTIIDFTKAEQIVSTSDINQMYISIPTTNILISLSVFVFYFLKRRDGE